MAREHEDSFDIYGTSTSFMTDGVYAEATGSLVADPDGSSTQRVFYCEGGGFRYPLETPANVVGQTLRMWMTSLPGTAGDNGQLIVPFSWRDQDNNIIVHCRIQTNGAIAVYETGSQGGTLIGNTGSPVVGAAGWWHLEARLKGGTSADGEFDLWVNGVNKLHVTGLTLDDATIYQTATYTDADTIGNIPGVYIKDYTVWNGLGSENNSQLGMVRVINLTPSADVDLGDWVPNSGTTAYDILDNNPPSDAAYLAAADTAADPLIMEMNDLPPDITTIKWLATWVHAKKIDGGDGNLQVGVISNGTPDTGADRPITTGNVYWRDGFEVDPDTSAAWSPGAVDDAQITIDRTA